MRVYYYVSRLIAQNLTFGLWCELSIYVPNFGVTKGITFAAFKSNSRTKAIFRNSGS